jgi:transcription elongation factor Elf1
MLEKWCPRCDSRLSEDEIWSGNIVEQSIKTTVMVCCNNCEQHHEIEVSSHFAQAIEMEASY